MEDIKSVLKQALSMANEDAKYWVYRFSNEGTFHMDREPKSFVQSLFKGVETVSLNPNHKDVVMFGDLGVSLNDFANNIAYETEDTDGFTEHVSKHNPYYKVFVRLDRENGIISYKLGAKNVTLKLVEWTDWVSRPYLRKGELHCASMDALEKHLNDESWSSHVIGVGRRILGLEKNKAAPQKDSQSCMTEASASIHMLLYRISIHPGQPKPFVNVNCSKPEIKFEIPFTRQPVKQS